MWSSRLSLIDTTTSKFQPVCNITKRKNGNIVPIVKATLLKYAI